MKRSFEGLKYRLTTFSLAMFTAITAMAQEEGGGSGSSEGVAVTSSSTTTTTTGMSENWYTEPWALILGAVVFILLLAAIIGGSRSRSRSTTTTTGSTGTGRTTVTRTDYEDA